MWSQIDANQHMRHSAYADFGAQARLNLLEKVGLSPTSLFIHKIGPVLFKEELFYLRELALGDTIKVTCELTRSRADGSRWSLRNELYSAGGVKAAVINVDGAWIDMEKRKVTVLPTELNKYFLNSPKSRDYQEDRDSK